MGISYKISANKDSKESTENLILKQGLRDFNHNILGESGSHFRIVASDNNEVVGGLIIERCSDAFYIKTLWVNENYRKAGIASKLMDMLIEKALSDKIHKIFTCKTVIIYLCLQQKISLKSAVPLIDLILMKQNQMNLFSYTFVELRPSLFQTQSYMLLDHAQHVMSFAAFQIK